MFLLKVAKQAGILQQMRWTNCSGIAPSFFDGMLAGAAVYDSEANGLTNLYAGRQILDVYKTNP